MTARERLSILQFSLSFLFLMSRVRAEVQAQDRSCLMQISLSFSLSAPLGERGRLRGCLPVSPSLPPSLPPSPTICLCFRSWLSRKLGCSRASPVIPVTKGAEGNKRREEGETTDVDVERASFRNPCLSCAPVIEAVAAAAAAAAVPDDGVRVLLSREEMIEIYIKNVVSLL